MTAFPEIGLLILLKVYPMTNLLMHCGGSHVTRDDIANAPTPDRTRTWVPVPHHRLLELAQTTTEDQGYSVRRSWLVEVACCASGLVNNLTRRKKRYSIRFS